MRLSELHSLMDSNGINPYEVSDDEFKYIESKISFKFSDSMKSFIRITNGRHIGYMSNKIIECDILSPGSYEPFSHPIRSVTLSYVFKYCRNESDKEGILYYIKYMERCSKERISLDPNKYVPIMEGLGETLILIERSSGNIVSFITDGEDPVEDINRTVISKSFDEFIDSCKIIDCEF